MRGAQVSKAFNATVAEAERCWYDTAGWHRWVDGLDEVLGVDGDWPRLGASVTWRSGPAGRGTVVERVTAFEPLEGQALEVADDSIRGHQRVSFVPAGEGVVVGLALEYKLVRRSIVSPLVDLLFIRRAISSSLESTLSRFGAELEASLSGRRS